MGENFAAFVDRLLDMAGVDATAAAGETGRKGKIGVTW